MAHRASSNFVLQADTTRYVVMVMCVLGSGILSSSIVVVVIAIVLAQPASIATWFIGIVVTAIV